jgi:hypothetical protein
MTGTSRGKMVAKHNVLRSSSGLNVQSGFMVMFVIPEASAFITRCPPEMERYLVSDVGTRSETRQETAVRIQFSRNLRQLFTKNYFLCKIYPVLDI